MSKHLTWLRLDPRTRLLVLLICAAQAFTVAVAGLWLALGVMFLYLLAQGMVRPALQFTLGFAVLYGLQLLIHTYAPSLSLIFGFMLYYFMRFIPVFMAAAALGAASPGELIAALQKLYLPRTVIIPLAVMLRYMPGIAQEYQAIQQAARLRGVSMSIFGLLRRPRLTLECALVPLLMRSLKIADELAASAATRGIEHPGKRSTLRPVQLRLADGVIAALMLIASIGILGYVA
ncbi:MAG: energy-coupling factor transporter transmembrane protein EcfT [Chloroflexia bacterium]|nr:energy-coupling factor transporter transmembrane protein EcfT [Chloroflexia bacterium]